VAIGEIMSPIKNVALVNELGQVINHVVVDTEDTETMDALHEQWGTYRHVETSNEDIIILHESNEVWTTHCDDPDCEKTGFNLPDLEVYAKVQGLEKPPVFEIAEEKHKVITIKGREYPDDSLLIKENVSKRPNGWVLPEGEVEVSLADKE
jgi:hypothetical protein